MPGFIICQGKPYPLLLLVLWEYNPICHLPVVPSCQAQAQPGSLSNSIAFTTESGEKARGGRGHHGWPSTLLSEY